ncbi:TetR/AcrR family transcriptional regulator [Alteromonas sp. H39]|uniref:TetR/AcrR family transcriptional regulator n=1 Tax=Alteromonas sp. H39 TaxID=3389876 RepID=UPI0039E13830
MLSKSLRAKIGRPKSKEKREQILKCATHLFLHNGFINSSMDMIAREAGVSKQTVYSHFNSKDELYTAVIDAKCKQYSFDPGRLESCERSLNDILMDIAYQIVELLQDPKVIAMYKVVISEASNSPHVAELFWRAGPLQSVETVAQIISANASDLSDAQAKAISTDFFNLLKSDFHMRSILQLPYELTEKQKQCICERARFQVLLMLENTAALPCPRPL